MTNTGVWQGIHGVFTPGGDPAWKCPFCGGSEHVYGIESPETYSQHCSNCNANLKYPWEVKDKQ